MSTVSSLLVMASGSLTYDLYVRIYNPNISDKSATKFCRLTTIAMAVAALGISMGVAFLSPERTIFWFAVFGWSGIGATFCPMIILSLFWPKFTERGAIASMLTGFLMTLVSKFLLQEVDGVGTYFSALETMPPSFISALLLGFAVSILWPDIELERNYSSELAQ